MKESLYGWYPAAKDVLKSYRQPNDSYNAECKYRHWNSTYNDQRGVSPPEAPTTFKIHLAARPPPTRKSTSSLSEQRPPAPYRATSAVPSPSPCRVDSRSESCADLLPESRSHSVASPIYKPCPPPKPTRMRSSASARKAWSMKLAETPITVLPPPTVQTPGDATEAALHAHAHAQTPTPQQTTRASPMPRAPSGKPSTAQSQQFSAERRDRVKSATICRPRVSAPPRPVKSADPRRRLKPGHAVYQDEVDERDEDTSPPLVIPPYALFPEKKQQLGVEEPLDYDEQLQKYGWRMEVPGDALNLKRPCITKRLPVTVKCTVPAVPPNPPKANGQTWDTFFINTIPRKPLTCTIHPEWLSEVLLAKRLQLQKRDGDQYQYQARDFAFAY